MKRTIVTLLIMGSTSVTAAPIQWSTAVGGNGHHYDFVLDDSISWGQARIQAEALTFRNVNGHLATLTSAAEQRFIADSFAGLRGYLGGYQDANSPDFSEPAGGWRWITGEPWSFTAWAPGEPNNRAVISSAPENVLEKLAGPSGWWNDTLPGNELQRGYLVEWATVPEPPGALLLGGAAILLLAGRRSRRSQFPPKQGSANPQSMREPRREPDLA